MPARKNRRLRLVDGFARSPPAWRRPAMTVGGDDRAEEEPDVRVRVPGGEVASSVREDVERDQDDQVERDAPRRRAP